MQTDVKSATVTSTGSVYAGRTRVKSLVLTATATAGSIVLTDGSGGDTLLTINTPAAADLHNILLPGEGILFRSSVYATLINVSAVTVVHG